MIRKLTATIAVLFLMVQAVGFAASINVPFLELMTRGYVQDGLFGFTSRGSLDLKIEGGVKFGGRVTLSYDTTNIEDGGDLVGVRFKSAEIEMRGILGLPMNVGFFIGQYDAFASGDAFPELFGTASIATRYRGFFYFPESIIYDGIHSVKGTGFSARFPTESERFQSSIYLYQDMRFTKPDPADPLVEVFFPGHYSLDVRALVNFPGIKLEAFAGATYPAPDALYGLYRAGLLFYAGETNVEFFAQVGMPRFAPSVDNISLNLFYLLFEPRVHLGFLHIIPTFFWHPQYYLQEETGELGSFDVNMNFLFKSEAAPSVSGGIEANLVFSTQESTGNQELAVTVSPYMSFTTPGVLWDLKVNANLFPFDFSSLVDVFLGIRAVF